MSDKITLRSVALIGALLFPASAMAASAIATGNVNLRAGPATGYPVVNVVPSGDDVEVFGCLSNRSWCDVDYYGQRGWMSSNYLAYVGGGQRYTGPVVIERIGAPVVSFSFGNYWDRHYRGRPFYRDRDRYDPIDRRDIRREVRREFRDDVRRERRDDRFERRLDRRQDRREDFVDRRQDRRDDRREERRDRREDRRDDRRDERRDDRRD